jgi:hypothetical protein
MKNFFAAFIRHLCGIYTAFGKNALNLPENNAISYAYPGRSSKNKY